MKNLMTRFFKRIFKSLFFVYAPVILVLAFALFYLKLFPDGPLWPIPVFVVLVIIYFPLIVKW